jgi:HSP20 family molecular chaperone IbpA
VNNWSLADQLASYETGSPSLTPRGGRSRPGSHKKVPIMIDDDFDKLVRDIFERFFGNAFKLVPGENGIQMRVGSEESIPESRTGRVLTVDEVDLGNEYLVIIETPVSVDSLVATVKDNVLEIRVSENVKRGIEVTIPFTVDIEKSNVSVLNGVIEARLVKAVDNTTRKREGTLTII